MLKPSLRVRVGDALYVGWQLMDGLRKTTRSQGQEETAD